jgi:hypothetical protein
VSLERVVRPFQNGDVFTARILLPNIPAAGFQFSQDVPILEWSGANPAKYTEVPSDLQLIGFTVDWSEDKTKRVTESVRVENPDDSSQYVMIDRIKSTVLYNSQTGQSFNMQFAKWDDERK